MEPTKCFENLRKSLIGHSITYTRLATNSLILYIDCEPGDKSGITIWLEPTWHVKGVTGVLVGSRQVQTDEDDNGRDGFESGAKALSALLKKKITSLDIEHLTYDLQIHLDNNYWIKTFVADPTDDESWHIRDITNHTRLIGSSHGLIVRKDSV